MKKRMVFLAIALLAISGFAFGESFAKNGMLVAPGSLNANLGLGLRYSSGFSLGGGIEYAIGNFAIAKTLPFTYGIAGRAGIDLASYVALSVGAFGTLHFSWGALKLPKELSWIGNFDTYLGLGLTVFPGVGFDTIGGLSYYLSNNIAINLESGLRASYLGLLFKI